MLIILFSIVFSVSVSVFPFLVCRSSIECSSSLVVHKSPKDLLLWKAHRYNPCQDNIYYC